MKVLIATPTYSWGLPIDLVKYLDNIKVPNGWWVWKCYISRTPIHMARNLALEEMLKGDYDFVIMNDDDQIPIWEDCFYNLLKENKDMISWLVRLRAKQDNLNILKTEIYSEEWNQGMYKYVNYKECKEKEVFEIWNAWSWLICLSKKVCKFMLDKYASQPFEQKATIYMKLIDWTRQEAWYNDDKVDMSLWKPQLCRRVLSEDYLFFERAIRWGYKL